MEGVHKFMCGKLHYFYFSSSFLLMVRIESSATIGSGNLRKWEDSTLKPSQAIRLRRVVVLIIVCQELSHHLHYLCLCIHVFVHPSAIESSSGARRGGIRWFGMSDVTFRDRN
jgi:hypothetical protein